MPASEAQIRRNKANAAHSSGPKSESGKARSRVNATKHGLTALLPDIEAAMSPEFAERRAQWAPEMNPVGKAGAWALDCAVAASLRIDRCERALDQITSDVKGRATLVWDQDRAIEAAEVATRLARDPVLASRQLQATFAGVGLLIELWLALAATLEKEDWSEAEASIALDLLGASPDLRSGRTLIDAPEGADSVAFRRQLTIKEVERLEQLQEEALAPLDEMDRQRAALGDLAILSKSGKLVLRYEREAWKRYWEAMKEVKGQAPTAPPVVVVPVPAQAPTPPPVVVVEPPKARERAATPPDRSVEEERRELRAQAAPIRNAVLEGLRAMGLHDEDSWLDELDRRTERTPSHPGSYVPIAAGSRKVGG